MTRQITTYTKDSHTRKTGAHIAAASRINSIGAEKSTVSRIFDGVTNICISAMRKKRRITDSFVELTERLADKTAREGLFGEDKGKNYLGTSVDYISD